jgi:hypothetical protein
MSIKMKFQDKLNEIKGNLNIMNGLERNFHQAKMIPSEFINSINIFTSKKPNLMGLKIKDEFLILNTSDFYSFRMKTINIPFSARLSCFKSQCIVDEDYLANFFKDNNDNPFALIEVIHALAFRGVDPKTEVSQIPPLNYDESDQYGYNRYTHIEDIAREGDLFFTYNPNSVMNGIIRKLDQSYWAHCGMITENGRLVEMTTSGIMYTSFKYLKENNIKVGLYRCPNFDSEYIKILSSNVESFVQQKPRYNYKGVIKHFVKKRFGFFKNEMTGPFPSDLLRHGRLDLKYYA